MGNAVAIDRDFPVLHRIFDLLRQAPLAHRLPRTVHSPDAPVVCSRPRRVIIEIRELGRIRIDAMDGGREAVEVFGILRRDFDLIARGSRISCVGINRIQKHAAISLAIGIVRDGCIPPAPCECACDICRLRKMRHRMPVQVIRTHAVEKRLLGRQLGHIEHETSCIHLGIPVHRRGGWGIILQIFRDFRENLHLISDSVQILRPDQVAVVPRLHPRRLRRADFTAAK